MKLSIIIVNYNVKYFIDQCLHSVFKALNNIESEVFVVDNNSVDSSCTLIKEKYPQVKLIENKKNVGFSKANNQAIRESKGEYILLLNPDTVVQEDTFARCIEFMDTHKDAGALGVKMIDGKGNFLPESKRGLPTPSVAFYKISGISKLFPKSKTFGRYHLGYLDKNESHSVDVLAGAFMFLRKEALDKVGLLDESFFMYGEDIDLSYRITKGGYKNYYFAGTTIIHYKGESTKKSSINYVIVFYNAMLLFAEKHFSRNNFKFFSLLIKPAIYLRASMAILKRFLKRIYLPVIDLLLMYGGYFFLKPWWESIKFEHGKYPDIYMYLIVPVYVFIWFVSLLFSGVYDNNGKLGRVLRGIGIGTIIILAIYALLPLDYRFSRILIILGSSWSIFSLVGFRYLMHLLNFRDFKLNELKKKKVVIVGEEEEASRVSKLLLQTQANPEIIGFVSKKTSSSSQYLGTEDQLEDILIVYKADEIIFCAKDVPAQNIINQMLKLSAIDFEYKIAPPESLSIIGSSSINTSGDLYLINLNSISKPSNKREKRLFDFFSSLLILTFFPVLMFFISSKIKALTNIMLVLIGKSTWVGYYSIAKNNQDDLPKIKPCILTPVDGLEKKDIPEELKKRLNYMYAKDYRFTNDLTILFRSLFKIGHNN